MIQSNEGSSDRTFFREVIEKARFIIDEQDVLWSVGMLRFVGAYITSKVISSPKEGLETNKIWMVPFRYQVNLHRNL